MMIFGLLIIPLMAGIGGFVAWLAARGYPSTWDRTTYVLAFPAIELIGACLFHFARRWQPTDIGLFVAKEVLGYGSLVIIAMGFGCWLGGLTYGRWLPKPQ